LSEADKPPNKQTWTDLSLKEKFDYLLLDMRESRMYVRNLQQHLAISKNCLKQIVGDRDSDSDKDSDSHSDSDKGKGEGKQEETKRRKVEIKEQSK